MNIPSSRQRYLDYLESEHWGLLREACFKRDGFKCVSCLSRDRIKPKKHPKPSRIKISYFDPLGSVLLLSTEWPYNADRSASGFYTDSIRFWKQHLHEVSFRNLGCRIPEAVVEMIP